MNRLHILIFSIVLLVVAGCNKEEFNGPTPVVTIYVANPDYDKTDINSPLLIEYTSGMTVNPGDKITFENNSAGDYVSIWTGDEGHDYTKYGTDEGENISGQTFEYVYETPGNYTITVVVTSAINKSEDVKQQTQQFQIQVTDSKAEMTEFSIDVPDIVVERDGDNYILTVPFGTDVTNLTPEFDAGFATVTVNGTVQESGVTANDFTQPLAYNLESQDGTNTSSFTVTINVVPGNTENWFTDFGFGSMPVTVTVNGNNINVVVPSDVDITSLKATFSSPDLATVTVNGEEQRNGRTRVDYTNPVTFVVTAQDGSIAEYIVTVTKSE